MASVTVREYRVSPPPPGVRIGRDDVKAMPSRQLELNLADVLRTNALAVPYRGARVAASPDGALIIATGDGVITALDGDGAPRGAPSTPANSPTPSWTSSRSTSTMLTSRSRRPATTPAADPRAAHHARLRRAGDRS